MYRLNLINRIIPSIQVYTLHKMHGRQWPHIVTQMHVTVSNYKPVGKAMNNIVIIAFPASCGYNSQYLWRRSGGMLFVYSLLELRTLPNELLIACMHVSPYNYIPAMCWLARKTTK